ncbi:MAG TPA: hypothetical protein VH814_09675 [Steroidobacteraceae bacterium]
MRSVVLLVLLALAPAVWCQTAGEARGSALDVIDRCGDSAPEDTYGLTDLESECPGLTNALEESGYMELLPPAARDQLSVYDLTEVAQVGRRYGQDEPADVDVGMLGPILDALRLPAIEPPPPSWFERFMRWLRELLEQRAKDPDNWLSRWLEGVNVSVVVVRTILLLALTLLIGVGIVVVVNELRTAGVLRRRPVAPDADAGAVAGLASDDIGDLDSLSADRKAPMLLRMLVATLIKSGRLRTERSLTCRELSARANFDDAQQRDCFRRVATLAERTVYGHGEVSAEEVEPIVAAARALDAQLRGAPA